MKDLATLLIGYIVDHVLLSLLNLCLTGRYYSDSFEISYRNVIHIDILVLLPNESLWRRWRMFCWWERLKLNFRC